ncbi:MAG TPA: hypothetical protein PLI09_03060 [Candidatus Hydrogenedentes bacterium]|nr:hypothetical protein [Candidatus Hydrogenedentota bacterium]
MRRYKRENKLRVTDFIPDIRPHPKKQPPDFTERHRAQALDNLQRVSHSDSIEIEPWRVELCRALIDVLDDIDPEDCVHMFTVAAGSPPEGWREYNVEAAIAVIRFEENGSDALLARLIAAAFVWGFGTHRYNNFYEVPLAPTSSPIFMLAAQKALNRWRSFQGLPPLKFDPDARHLMRAEMGLPFVDPLPPGYEVILPLPNVIVLGVR